MTETRKNLQVTLEAGEIDDELKGITKDFVRHARIPGFRPGKAPEAMVAKRFQKEIRDELRQKVLARGYREGLKEAKLDVLQLIDVNEPEVNPGQDVDITFTIDIRPAFELPDYKGIPATAKATEVTDEEVEEMITNLRRDRADYEPVERPSQAGDYVMIAYEGTVDGRPITEIAPEKPVFGKMPKTWEEAGSGEGLIPGLGLGLVGVSKGEKKEVPVTFPAGYQEAALAGKAAVYQVEVQEVRERVLPEIDESFLKAHHAGSLDELKENVRKSLVRRKESEQRSEIRQQISDALAGKVDFPIPESLIESETQVLLRRFIEDNLRRGMPESELENNKDELYSGARKAAIMRVKLQLILARIAEQEKLKVTDEDFSRFIMAEALRSRSKPDKLARELKKDRQRLQAIHQNLLFDKTLDFVVGQASLSKAG